MTGPISSHQVMRSVGEIPDSSRAAAVIPSNARGSRLGKRVTGGASGNLTRVPAGIVT